VWVNDCLNLGVGPRALVDTVKDKVRGYSGSRASPDTGMGPLSLPTLFVLVTEHGVRESF
jgi:hypothetical protein